MPDPHAPRSPGTRRDFLKSGAAAMAVATAYGLLPGRGLASNVPSQFDGTKFQLAEPNAKHGGVLRVAHLSRQPHFDLHQSATFASIGTQGCMFDNLLRRDPRDGQTIIPDLAHSWESNAEGTRYTFMLRQGVHFHDGAELTADDVKATFDRISKPPAGISIPRSSLFTALHEIRARDKYTVEFVMAEPRPANFVLSSIASGWNVILRKQTLEENNGDLRKVMIYPGTGPFKSVRRVENEIWVFARNKDYWDKDLPYLDGVEHYHALPFSPEMASALLAGRVDYARVVDQGTIQRVKATAGMSSAIYNQSVIDAVWPNNRKKPYDDPRVRRAMHLVLDRNVLIEVVKDLAPMVSGGMIYPFSDFATPRDELAKRLGYQADPTAAIKEAKALMAAAGHGDGLKGQDMMVRDFANQRLWAQAIQQMLQQTLNIEMKYRMAIESIWYDDVQRGNYDIALGVILSTLLDPSDYFRAWYSKDGPQNHSFWDNRQFNALLPQIDREVDPVKRLSLIRQAEKLMEDDPPLLPICWERVQDAWYNYVKGVHPDGYFGLYDVDRYDTAWLDKA